MSESRVWASMNVPERYAALGHRLFRRDLSAEKRLDRRLLSAVSVGPIEKAVRNKARLISTALGGVSGMPKRGGPSTAR